MILLAVSDSTHQYTTTSSNTAVGHAGLVLMLQANCPQQINPKLDPIPDILCLLV